MKKFFIRVDLRTEINIHSLYIAYSLYFSRVESNVVTNMTLDKEKNSLHPFVLKCNVSACYQDVSNMSTQESQPWITVCGHIFCASCGMTELGKLPAICPICSHQLTSPFDIIQSELNPPSHFVEVSNLMYKLFLSLLSLFLYQQFFSVLFNKCCYNSK